jgi:hypothetical protein
MISSLAWDLFCLSLESPCQEEDQKVSFKPGFSTTRQALQVTEKDLSEAPLSLMVHH